MFDKELKDSVTAQRSRFSINTDRKLSPSEGNLREFKKSARKFY